MSEQTIDQQLAEAEKMASVCAESAKMWQEKVDKLRAQREEKRGPFGLPVNCDSVVFTPVFYLNRTESGQWSSGQGSFHNFSVESAERELIALSDALNAARGLVAVDKKQMAPLFAWDAKHRNVFIENSPNRELYDLAMELRKQFDAGARRRSR